MGDYENETSAQELMALVVPKDDDDDDDDEDDEDDVGNDSNAFMNDTASSIGDAVAAVLADAATADVEDEDDDDGEENREEGPSYLNLDGPEPTPPANSVLPVQTAIGCIKMNNVDGQQPLFGMAPIPTIPPNLLQQAGNAAVFAAAAMNPYILAAASGGYSVAPNNILLMQQPQQEPQQQQQQPLQQQQQLLNQQLLQSQQLQGNPSSSLSLQLANPACMLAVAAAATGNNSSSLLENVALNPVLLQQQQQLDMSGDVSHVPTENNDNSVVLPPAMGFQLAQPQQLPLLDPAAFLSAALLMQSGGMLVSGGIPQQVMAQPYNNSNNSNSNNNPFIPIVSTSNGAETGNVISGNGMLLPSNVMLPPATLQQLVPMFAAAIGAVSGPVQTQQLQQQEQEQSQPQQHQQQQPAVAANSSPALVSSQQNDPHRVSIPLYLDHDENCLTPYQCFLRKQIELFEAGDDELQGTAQGRNTPLHRGQIGIRCRHCAHLPKAARARGGVYYSRTIDGVCKFLQQCILLSLH
jgi:hypothetical protein